MKRRTPEAENQRQNKARGQGQGRAVLRLMRIVLGADRRGSTALLLVKATEATSLPAQAVSLKIATDGLTTHNGNTVAVGLGVLAAAVVMRGVAAAGSHVQYTVGDRAEIAVSEHLVRTAARLPGLDHVERPAFNDRMALLRDGTGTLAAAALGVIQTTMLAVQLAITAVLLARVSPWMLALPLIALVWVQLAGSGNSLAHRHREATAELARREEHFTTLTLTSGPAKELRVFGLAGPITDEARELWREITRRVLRGERRGALLGLSGLMVFTLAVAGCVLGTAVLAHDGQATTGDVVLVLNTALLALGQVAGLVWAFRSVADGMRVVVHMQWLDDLADRADAEAPQHTSPVPDVLRRGIELRGVAFAYPSSSRPALQNVDLAIPAGSTVAIVGDNGAGKTTLVKLLCGFYTPTAGEILVDGEPLSAMAPAEWRARLTATFQDYVNYEFLTRENIGQGDVQRIGDDAALRAAADAAGATTILDRLPDGLDAQLGKRFDGTDLSGGQWHRLALARGRLRTGPLLHILDEPTAALDPAAERDLVMRYFDGGRADRARNGTVTLVVSHRFATVRAADLIVVVQDGTIAEYGTHEDLMAADGPYSDLYELSVRAYA